LLEPADHAFSAVFTIPDFRGDPERAKTALQTVRQQNQDPVRGNLPVPVFPQNPLVIEGHEAFGDRAPFLVPVGFPHFAEQVTGIIAAIQHFYQKIFNHFSPLDPYISLYHLISRFVYSFYAFFGKSGVIFQQKENFPRRKIFAHLKKKP
jgi:hypothetical protein